MLIVLTILLAVAVLLALAYPMLKDTRGQAALSSGSAAAGSSAQETLHELLAQRDAAFQAIRDLKFDHEVGKITDEDLATYEAGLKQQAANALRRLDAWEHDVDQKIAGSFEGPARKAVPAARPASQPRSAAGDGTEAPVMDALEAQIAARRAALARGTVPCPSCGRPVTAGNEFCTACGSRISATARVPVAPQGPACPSCGRPVQPDDRFCPRCGQPLGQPRLGDPVAG